MAKSLLMCVTPVATEYIRKMLTASNPDDFRKLKKLSGAREERCFEASNGTDTDLDITVFDWCSAEKDRNWWWQMQALPFLGWYYGGYDLLGEEEQAHLARFCLDALFNWVHQAKDNLFSPLRWHDHAAAFRVRNLTNWLLFAHLKALPVLKDERISTLENILIEHLEWLQDDRNYSRRTNHGFDQVMIALKVSLMFDCDGFEPYRQKNRKRLKDEISFAFTEEGVHKENSPGYQKFMLARLRQLGDLVLLGETELADLSADRILKAENFLRAITLPNGFLPMIGDTRGQDKGIDYTQENEIDVLDYSRSGYVIIRGKVLEKDFHLIFKASHLSRYHRHDDDLSIHLYFNGEVVLGDGGLGSHDEMDPRRMSLRSWRAHNIPYVEDVDPVRDVENPFETPRVFLGDGVIFGESRTYGVLLKRELCFSDLSNGKLYLKDYFALPFGGISSNFYSSMEKKERKEGALIINLDDGFFLEIISNDALDARPHTAFYSERFGEFYESLACKFVSPGRLSSFVISIGRN